MTKASVSVTLPADLLTRAWKIAERTGQPLSRVMASALEAWIEDDEAGQDGELEEVVTQ